MSDDMKPPAQPLTPEEIAGLRRSDEEWLLTASGFDAVTVRRLLATLDASKHDAKAWADRYEALRRTLDDARATLDACAVEIAKLRAEMDEAVTLLSDDAAAIGLVEAIKRRTYMLQRAMDERDEARECARRIIVALDESDAQMKDAVEDVLRALPLPGDER